MYEAYDVFQKLKGGSCGYEYSGMNKEREEYKHQTTVGQSKVVGLYSK